jgi:hypothetical protein
MRGLLAWLNVPATLARIERNTRIIMSQDQDLATAVSDLTTSVSTEAADIATLLQSSPVATSDPAVANAITKLQALKTSVDAADADIKAKIPAAPVEAAPETPAQ